MSTEVVSIDDVHADPANVRRHPERNQATIRASLTRFGPGRSLVLDGRNVVRAGNGTLEQARQNGFDEVVIVDPKPNQLVAVRRLDWSDTEATGYAIADNRSSDIATNDDTALAEQLDVLRNAAPDMLPALGYDVPEIDAMIEGLANGLLGYTGETAEDGEAKPNASLAERFGVPPFSVLDARQGYWQERKRQWISLGIKGELGRGGGVGSQGMNTHSPTITQNPDGTLNYGVPHHSK